MRGCAGTKDSGGVNFGGNAKLGGIILVGETLVSVLPEAIVRSDSSGGGNPRRKGIERKGVIQLGSRGSP